jgi:hypothetical protein
VIQKHLGITEKREYDRIVELDLNVWIDANGIHIINRDRHGRPLQEWTFDRDGERRIVPFTV